MRMVAMVYRYPTIKIRFWIAWLSCLLHHQHHQKLQQNCSFLSMVRDHHKPNGWSFTTQQRIPWILVTIQFLYSGTDRHRQIIPILLLVNFYRPKHLLSPGKKPILLLRPMRTQFFRTEVVRRSVLTVMMPWFC